MDVDCCRCRHAVTYLGHCPPEAVKTDSGTVKAAANFWVISFKFFFVPAGPCHTRSALCSSPSTHLPLHAAPFPFTLLSLPPSHCLPPRTSDMHRCSYLLRCADHGFPSSPCYSPLPLIVPTTGIAHQSSYIHPIYQMVHPPGPSDHLPDL